MTVKMCESRSNLLKLLFIFVLLISSADASFLEWILGESQDSLDTKLKPGEVPAVKIPFEVNTEDEKFLEEAKKYTSLKLSDLDSCQHHIVLQIRNSCADMTEEDLAKMSVNLLNCQSAVEGRQQFPCTKTMSLRQCTSAMDSDMWNTYHLMNNRARAVCYAARHQQFRALSEMTVNKLMDTAAHQLDSMKKLTEGQHKLESMTSHAIETLEIGHKDLMQEQEKFRNNQQSLQQFVSLNLRQLTREKALIAAGHQELTKMTDVVTKLETNTEDILAQMEMASLQYEQTLQKLAQINATINFLLGVMDNTRKEFDTRLGWIAGVIGGTGSQLDQLFSCIKHGVYLVFAMIAISFLSAPTLTRAFLVFMVPLNLAVEYHQGSDAALNFPSMTILLMLSAILNCGIQFARDLWKNRQAVPVYPLPGVPVSPITNGYVPTSSPMNPEVNTPCTNKLIDLLNMVLQRISSIMKNIIYRSEEKPLRSSSSCGDSSDNDDVDSEETFSERLSYSNYGNSEFLRPVQRMRCDPNTKPIHWKSRDAWSEQRLRISPVTPDISAPIPSDTSSRSGTPRLTCHAITKNGQPCKNSATPGSDVCYRHHSESSFRDY